MCYNIFFITARYPLTGNQADVYLNGLNTYNLGQASVQILIFYFKLNLHTLHRNEISMWQCFSTDTVVCSDVLHNWDAQMSGLNGDKLENVF